MIKNSHFATIEQAIEQKILQCLKQKRNLLVAYSGGVDSSVLLHGLVKLKRHKLPDLQLKAIYINHGLSVNADSWAEHCQIQCQKWQIPLIIEKLRLDRNAGNIEEQARNARYQAIYHHLKEHEMLCTAQHLDDQCETFFLALKRGSGPAGLSGMLQKNKKHLRPLLSISRQNIEDYARVNKLTWIEDESNLDDHYDRNFLRLKILPTLNQRWPHFSQMVARSAELCQQQEKLIEELLLVEFQQMSTSQNQISIESLIHCTEYKRNAILRMWFKFNSINMPTRQQITLIWQTVALSKQDANPQFILHDKQIRRFQNQLYLLPHYLNIEAQVLNWDLTSSLVLPDGVGELVITEQTGLLCRLPNENEDVTIRFHAQGKFQVVGRQGSRTIKKIWQEYRIPSWQRTRIPLIYYNEQLIMAVNVFVTQQGKGSEIGFSILK